MLSKIQFILDTHLGRINIAEHFIDLLQLITASVRSASDRAGPRAWKFEKAGIHQVRAEHVVELAKIRAAAPIDFVSQKNGTVS